jgi:hypothetical protein
VGNEALRLNAKLTGWAAKLRQRLYQPGNRFGLLEAIP